MANESFREAVNSKKPNNVTYSFLRDNLKYNNLPAHINNIEDHGCTSSLIEETSEEEFDFYFSKALKKKNGLWPIKQRLKWWIEPHHIFPFYQNGFRKGRSCINSVLGFKTYIKDAFKDKLKVGAIFVDITGALDNVNTLKLISMIRDMGLPDNIIKFISFVLLNREVSGYFNEHALGTRTGSIGVPQGSVLTN